MTDSPAASAAVERLGRGVDVGAGVVVGVHHVGDRAAVRADDDVGAVEAGGRADDLPAGALILLAV
jgi:hypothetical protein